MAERYGRVSRGWRHGHGDQGNRGRDRQGHEITTRVCFLSMTRPSESSSRLRVPGGRHLTGAPRGTGIRYITDLDLYESAPCCTAPTATRPRCPSRVHPYSRPKRPAVRSRRNAGPGCPWRTVLDLRPPGRGDRSRWTPARRGAHLPAVRRGGRRAH